MILLLFIAISGQVNGQADDNYQAPRTPDGHPDLQGVWENNTITPVERPDVFGNKEMLTDEDMAFIQQRIGEIMAAGEDALFGGGVLEAVFSGEINSYDPTTGNYDSQWMAERTVHRRTSQIIDPPNGKYPPRTEAAVAAARELREWRAAHPADSWTDRPLGERCLSFGAPRLGSGYNSYWQIVQSRDTVVIYQEMAHDARIIPIVEQPHAPASVKSGTAIHAAGGKATPWSLKQRIILMPAAPARRRTGKSTWSVSPESAITHCSISSRRVIRDNSPPPSPGRLFLTIRPTKFMNTPVMRVTTACTTFCPGTGPKRDWQRKIRTIKQQ